MDNGMRFKKKKRTTLYAGIVTAVVLIAALAGLRYLQAEKDAAQNKETETQQTEHTILMYKTSDGVIEFDAAWMKTDSDTETVLSVEENTLVTMLVTPEDGKLLESVDVVDYQFNKIDSFLRDAENGATRVNFVMPDMDIIMNCNFQNEETESEAETERETGTEPETETEGMPYGLTLRGLTPDIITSYNGQFDDQYFLQQLGDALHMDSARSDYRDVTDVTISQEPYEGEQEADKIYHYIYFNNDAERKVLSTYYLKDNAYVFTEPEEPETETETQATGTGSTVAGNTQTSGTPSYGGTAAGNSQTTETTSFDVLQVSTVFLAFTGDESGERFYQELFDYVLEKKAGGNIVGTFGTYSISPEDEKAEFMVTLNVGGTIQGSFDKKKNVFEFSGL